MAEDVRHARHGLLPVLEIGQRLFPKLQFVGQAGEVRRIVGAVPHERAVRLVGVDHDQQVLDLAGQAALLGLIGPAPDFLDHRR